jgi:general secretion pathway protein A
MRQVNQRILLRATLQPLDREALEAYVNWRLSVARSTTSVAFETEALDLVQTVSSGVPRMINLLCDRALAAGATEGVSDTTPAHVRIAAADLGFPLPAESRWSRRTTVTVIGIVAAVLVAAAAVFAAVPADSLVALSRPAAPIAPAPALARPIAALAPPTEDLLLPPPILPPPVPRRVALPAAPISTDPLPSVR